MDLRDRIKTIVDFLKTKMNDNYRIGIITGSGFNSLEKLIKVDVEIPYSDIPNFLVSTAPGHCGKLIFGKIGDKNVIMFLGRFHGYEGYKLREINIPIRVLKYYGCEYLILTNAAGGLNPNYYEGDIVLIKDHINLMGDNPLIGPNDDELGPRFPDMSDAYNKEQRELIKKIAMNEKIYIHEGVYIGLKGPNLETNAEYRMLRLLGADLVGMSTVPETISAVHCGIKVAALSIVSNRCIPDCINPTTGEDVIKVVEQNSEKVSKIIEKYVLSI